MMDSPGKIEILPNGEIRAVDMSVTLCQEDIKHLEKVTAELRKEKPGEYITLRRANHEEWLIGKVRDLSGLSLESEKKTETKGNNQP